MCPSWVDCRSTAVGHRCHRWLSDPIPSHASPSTRKRERERRRERINSFTSPRSWAAQVYYNTFLEKGREHAWCILYELAGWLVPSIRSFAASKKDIKSYKLAQWANGGLYRERTRPSTHAATRSWTPHSFAHLFSFSPPWWFVTHAMPQEVRYMYITSHSTGYSIQCKSQKSFFYLIIGCIKLISTLKSVGTICYTLRTRRFLPCHIYILYATLTLHIEDISHTLTLIDDFKAIQQSNWNTTESAGI